MKRVLSLVLAITMIISCFAAVAQAQEADVTIVGLAGKVEVVDGWYEAEATESSLSVQPGDIVRVEWIWTLSDAMEAIDERIGAFNCLVSYDENIFELSSQDYEDPDVEWAMGDAFLDFASDRKMRYTGSTMLWNIETNPIQGGFTNANGVGYKANDRMWLSAQFKVKDSAVAGTYPITFSVDPLTNSGVGDASRNLVADVQDCSIVVEGPLGPHAQVIAQINALPDVAELTLDDKPAVDAARAAYTALSTADREKVTNYNDLVAAENRINELIAGNQDAQAAAAVDAQISAIGEVTLAKESAIVAARSAYTALTATQQGLVKNLATLVAAEGVLAELKAAAAVDAKITALGTVTLAKAADVDAARKAYENLSVTAKSYVTKLNILVAAEGKIADLTAAKAVDDEIEAIGEVTLAKGNAIRTARANFKALTTTQQGYVTKLNVLIAAENALAVLEAGQADQVAAQNVMDLIEAIGTVALDKEADIIAARSAYDSLTDSQKTIVNNYNYSTLVAAEEELDRLKAAAGDSAVAAAVEAQIAAIGEVTLAKEATIAAVRGAFDALTNKQKRLVTNIATLVAAEKEIARLKAIEADKAAAKVVDDAINALPEPDDVTPANADEIAEVRSAYTELTDAQQGYVENLDTLVAVETALADFAAKQVIAAIAALPVAADVTVDDADAIAAARNAYMALSTTDRAKVNNYDKLVADENKLVEISDRAAAAAVDAKISAIGTVTIDSENAIASARGSYDALNAAQKTFVTKLAVLKAAEDTLAQIKADISRARTVISVIAALPNVSDVTPDNQSAVTAARTAYNGLTTSQKDYVTNYQKLLDAENALKNYIVTQVVRMIAALPAAEDVASSDATAIKSARSAFDGLSSADKLLVYNLQRLLDAETALGTLEFVSVDLTVTGQVDGEQVASAKAGDNALVEWVWELSEDMAQDDRRVGAFTCTVDYDTDIFELCSQDEEDPTNLDYAFDDKFTIFANKPYNYRNSTLLWNRTQNPLVGGFTSADGIGKLASGEWWFNVMLKVKDNAPTGAYPVTITISDLKDTSEEAAELTCSVKNCYIYVTGQNTDNTEVFVNGVANKENINGGDEVVVTWDFEYSDAMLSAANGVAAVNAEIYYNTDNFTFVSYEENNSINTNNDLITAWNTRKSPIKLGMASTRGLGAGASGKWWFKTTFAAKDNAPNGDYPFVIKFTTLESNDGENVEHRPLKSIVTNAVVTVGTSVDSEVNAVNALIAALPEPANITPADATVVQNARAAYDDLTDDQKANITNYAKLTDDEKALAEYASKQVVAAIAALPAVADATLQDATAINAARNAYKALSDTEKALVSNIDKLTALEAQLIVLADKAAAKAVDDKINAIGDVTLDKEDEIVAARNAYKALTTEQKMYVEKLAVLEAAEQALATLKKNLSDGEAAQHVEDLIDAIGIVSLEKEDAIIAAREAYDDLNRAQEAYVENYQTLLDAEARIVELKQYAIDKAAAQDVDNLINAIGTVTLEKENDILAARAAYDELTDVQQDMVLRLDILENAEARLAELKEDAANRAAAKAVEEKIDAIGEVTLDSLSLIVAAENAYEALTDAQKLYVGNHDVLLAAKQKYDIISQGKYDLRITGTINGNTQAAVAPGKTVLVEYAWTLLDPMIADGKDERVGAFNAEFYYDTDVFELCSQDEYEPDNIEYAFSDNFITFADRPYRYPNTTFITNANSYPVKAALTNANGIGEKVSGMVWFSIQFKVKDGVEPGTYPITLKIPNICNSATIDSGNARDLMPEIKNCSVVIADGAQAAAAVDALIDAIGTVTLDKEDEIVAAREAYDALTDDQKDLVTKYDVLTAAEAALAAIKDDVAAAKAVDDKIDAIGTVTLDKEDEIEAAREAYDALTDAQEELVTKYDVLVAAEAALQALKDDVAAAKAVDDKIDAIGTVTLDKEDEIKAAREAYEALTDAQEELVTKYDVLVAAEERIDELKAIEADKAAAKAVDDKIDAIGTVTLDKEDEIEAARDAYEALTDAQKGYVTKEDVLVDAETALQALKDDVAAAKAVDDKIDAIGEVTLDKEDEIKAARDAYKALTDAQEELVTKYDVLVAAEAKLEELKNTAGQEAIDRAAAAEVDQLINALPEADDVTIADFEKIADVLEAYEALTETQKGYVNNKVKLNAVVAVTQIQDIDVFTAPIKIEYAIGSKLVTDGLRVKVYYGNGLYEILDNGFDVTALASATAGTKTITVTYGEFTDTFAVKVLSAQPDDVDLEGLIAYAGTVLGSTTPSFSGLLDMGYSIKSATAFVLAYANANLVNDKDDADNYERSSVYNELQAAINGLVSGGMMTQQDYEDLIDYVGSIDDDNFAAKRPFMFLLNEVSDKAGKMGIIPDNKALLDELIVDYYERYNDLDFGNLIDDTADIDSIDALFVLNYSVGYYVVNGEKVDSVNYAKADVNGDGVVDSIDALWVLNYSVGFVESFPVNSMA